MKFTRFELKLPLDQRRELTELANEIGVTSAVIMRLALRRALENPGALLRSAAATEQTGRSI